MYAGWRIKRWETPVVDLDRTLMVSLTDAKQELVIVFEGSPPSRSRWRVRFRDYPAYRNIDELHRANLWLWLDESGQRCGATFIVDEQTRFASWDAPSLDVFEPKVRYFVIATNDDVIEVLSAAEPIWDAIEAARVDEPLPGKSVHLHFGEDDGEIRRLGEDLESRTKKRGSLNRAAKSTSAS
jgi:hypothetical protein